jgi:hypothetical protein
MLTNVEHSVSDPIREFEFLSPVADFVLGFTDIVDEMRSDEVGMSCFVSDVKVDMPIEIGVKVDADGNIGLASAPPTQQIETTIFPVLHRMRLGLVVENGSERD